MFILLSFQLAITIGIDNTGNDLVCTAKAGSLILEAVAVGESVGIDEQHGITKQPGNLIIYQRYRADPGAFTGCQGILPEFQFSAFIIYPPEIFRAIQHP
jgi:hypothetical protein